MDQVPKILKALVNEWTPEGYIVSFKVGILSLFLPTPCGGHRWSPFVLLPRLTIYSQLETDPTILIPKARQALDRYGHQLVIGNELHTRKFKVVFVERQSIGEDASQERYKEEWIKIRDDGADEIEQLIVGKLIEKHSAWIKAGEGKDPVLF